MGADLIGFMIRRKPDAPEQITEQMKAEGLAIAHEVREALSKVLGPEGADRTWDLDNVPDPLREFLDNECPSDDRDDRIAAIEFIDELFKPDHEPPTADSVGGAMEALLADFQETVSCARDVMLGQFSDGSTVFFAGEMSWGDSPEGAGYEFLKRLTYHPFFDLLGFE